MDSSPKHPLVLVVEPSPTLQKIIKFTFDREGGQTILYHEPEHVLRVFRQNPFPIPDIAFIDLTTKKSYRLIRVLKSRQEWKRLAIVALSSRDSHLSRLKARCAGAIAYLPKPFTTAQLVACAMNHSRH
ncbi:MAG TPA: response regulator [Ktedonobacteraceae bacterium]|jgi:DNA-binding response OmpR family regulator